MSEFPYDTKDIKSIFEYSKHLIHKCLRDFAPSVTDISGKGALGLLVEELYFKYNRNCRQESDFAFVHTELKCTPLKKTAKGELRIKERLVCSMINYEEDWNKSFEDSNFYQKCLTMLILFYLHEPNISKLDLQFLFVVLWQLPEKDLLIMRQDYDRIITKLREGKAHTLSEGDTMYLGACRKGAKGDTLMSQHNNDIKAPRRAWSLKPAYMRVILEEVKQRSTANSYCNFDIHTIAANAMFSVDGLKKNTTEEILRQRFAPFIGKTYSQICEALQIETSTSKAKYFSIANLIAGEGRVHNVNKSEEFIKSGMVMKTVRVQKTGSIKEAMSFENIDYQEVLECDIWEDSRLYELFSNRFLFVVFAETNERLSLSGGTTEPEYRLEKIGFWTMPQDDLRVAHKYWLNIKHNIAQNHISPQYFWSLKDDNYFHVRPKARVAEDKILSPSGILVKKYCYWFNQKYVKKIIQNEL